MANNKFFGEVGNFILAKIHGKQNTKNNNFFKN